MAGAKSIARQGVIREVIQVEGKDQVIVAPAGATLQYQREVRRLQHDDFTYRHSRSIATWTALVITLIGVDALLMLAAGGLPA